MVFKTAKELGFSPGLGSLRNSREDTPCLPLRDTEKMLSHMSKDDWGIPKEPYTFFEKIEEGEPVFFQENKRRRFIEKCQSVLGEWVDYLDRVQRGNLIVERAINGHVIRGDFESIESYDFFYRAMRPRLSKEKIEIEDAVDSCRRAILFLLTDDQAGQHGYRRPEKLEDNDIKNAKYLIRRSVSIVFPGFPIEVD